MKDETGEAVTDERQREKFKLGACLKSKSQGTIKKH